jgi:hypothetical protein
MKYIYTAMLCLFLGFSQAQEELSLYFQPEVMQSGLLNPAFAPKGTFNLSGGSSYFHMDLRGPRLARFFLGLDYLEELSEGIGRSYLSTDASFHVLDVGWKKNNIYYRLGYHTSSSMFVDLSPEFNNLLTFGNAGDVGREISLSPSLFLNHMNEMYFGMSVPLYDGMYQLGGNVKLVSGSFNLSTPRNDISLTTGEEFYQLSLESDFLLNGSWNDIEFRLRDFVPFSNLLRDNYGASLDLGFQYKEGPWTYSVSVLDIGFINWRSNTFNVKSEGAFEFDGFDFSEITVDTISVLADSLVTTFSTEISNDRYLTYTPLKTILSAQYKYGKWRFGGILYGEFKQNRFLPAVGVNSTRRLWKFWDIGFSYAYKNNTYSNLGLHSVMNIGPVQLYAMSDNVIGVFLPWQNWKVNFRVGGNLNFGQPRVPRIKGDSNTAYLY